MQFTYNNQRIVTFFYGTLVDVIDICTMKTEISVKFKFFLSLLFFLIAIESNAQENISLQIEWKESNERVPNEENYFYPAFSGNGFFGLIPYYYYSQEVSPSYNSKFEIVDYATSVANAKEIAYLSYFNIDVPTVLTSDLKVVNGAGKRYISFEILPFIREGNTIRRITTIVVKPTKSISNSTNFNKDFASESVLRNGNGTWYKVAISQDGIYRMDKAFLESLGINTSGLNPQHINIYGNGQGMLPTQNSVPRPDDLVLNAITIVGEGDGSFDNGDYILFHAWGPNRWTVSGGRYVNAKNIYSDYAYYFININSSVAPNRIQNASNPISPVTHAISTYSFKIVHENDNVNFIAAGQRWYGEQFDVNLSQTFNFPVPNAQLGANSEFEVAIASNATSPANTEQRYTLNGTQIFSTSLPTGNYGRSQNTIPFVNNSSNLGLNITIVRSSPATLTYLDRIQLNTRRNLVFFGNQFLFSDLESVGAGNVGEFTLANLPTNGFVWDVTNRFEPRLVQGNFSGSNYMFQANLDTIREFVASNGSAYFTPTAVGYVAPQNLHGLPQADYLIVTHPNFLSQANRLAQLHQQVEGMSVHVVTTNQIYNEFSCGQYDPIAIRMFAKMFYDRAISAPDTKPKYLCLFGDATYDPKNRISNNNNFVPTYEFSSGSSSESFSGTVVTDDLFGYLDDSESVGGSDKVDIGIGRLLVSDVQMATEQVDKVEHYLKNGSTLFAENNPNCLDGVSTNTFGDWRNKMLFVADDEDYFINTLEPKYLDIKLSNPEVNIKKLYMDGMERESTVGGYRFPEVNRGINDAFGSGTLVLSYVGHGSEIQLADEQIITTPIAQSYRNIDNMPLMITATCEFARYDYPERVSTGEWIHINPNGGVIAILTTSRLLSYGDAQNLTQDFMDEVLVRNADFAPRTFGEISMHTKIAAGGSGSRELALFGDPALKIALPKYQIVIDSINGMNPNIQEDTIQALSKVMVKAHFEDHLGNVLTGFNGVAIPSLYDKPKTVQTFGRNPGPGTIGVTNVLDYEIQQNIIYRGKSTVTNGYFSFEFVTPKDIDYSYGNGKFSLYGNSNSTDGTGKETRVIIGGVDPNGLDDNVGPEIDMYLNTEEFANGGLTNESPFLIAKVSDENGINMVGNGIGHDITAVIDGKTSDPVVLNEYFSNNLDSYQEGELRYQFLDLTPGPHTLTLKVWDVNNNSSERTIDFIVQEEQNLRIERVLNYPNPFTTNTHFYFEHNQCCTELETQVQIFTVSGKVVRTINSTMTTSGYRSEGIQWDGKDDFGDKLAKGVYVYRVKVRTPDGFTAEKLEKLVLL